MTFHSYNLIGTVFTNKNHKSDRYLGDIKRINNNGGQEGGTSGRKSSFFNSQLGVGIGIDMWS